MDKNALRSFVRNIITEAKKAKEEAKKGKGLPKSGGKLVELKKELSSLNKMKEALSQYALNEGTEEPIAEFAHLQRFVNEMAKLKMAYSKLSEMLETQINEVKSKIESETHKIKEMIGLVSEEDTKKKMMGEKKKMTPAQKEKKEDIVKGMKKGKGDFEKRYGKEEGESVMYATATKLAKKK